MGIVKIQKILRYIQDSDYRFLVNYAHGLYNRMDDTEYITRMFHAKKGYDLDLNKPMTFNEKLQWLKLYDRKPVYTTMVDKVEAKKYVASVIGEEYIIPTLGVWDRAEDIDFDSLPNQFVLKCTHDSHGLVICKDKSKLNVEDAKKKLSKALKRNYYLLFREWPYKDVKPRIIAEQYMQDAPTSALYDYSFSCFGGIAKCFKVDFDRFTSHHASYYDPEGNSLKIGEVVCPPDLDKAIVLPESLPRMITLSEQLATENSFLRVDFYDVNEKVYFGELTFYPASALGKFIFEDNDKLLGAWIKLPESSGGGYTLIYNDIVLLYRQSIVSEAPLKDYKIYTFNGEAKLCMINQNRGRHTRADYFDKDYNWLDFTWGYDHADVPPQRPKNYEKMFDLAEKLATGTTELRVDFYEVNGKVLFGELTFFDGSGFDEIKPIEWDYKLGSWVQLPMK